MKYEETKKGTKLFDNKNTPQVVRYTQYIFHPVSGIQ